MGLNNIKKSITKTFLELTSFQMLAMFRRGLFYTYLSMYMRNFLLLPMTIVSLYATFPMLMSVFFQNVVWGPISDKFQKRRTLIILGEILAGIGTIIVWFIHSGFNNFLFAGWVIIIGLTCIEAFWSMSNIGWSALISDIYPSKDRSRIMGQLTSFGGLGRIIGVLIGGYLYDNGFGFRNGSLFFIASFVMFISTLPMFWAPEGGINNSIVDEQKEDMINENKANTKFKRIFAVFIISLVFINFGRNSIATTYSPFLSLSSGFDLDPVIIGYIANTRSIAVIIIGFCAAFLSRKLGHSKTLIFGIFLAIAALIITALTSSVFLIFVGSFFIGAGEVIIYASSYTIASNLIPERIRAKLFGVYNATFFLSWGLPSTILLAPLIDILTPSVGQNFAYQVSFIVAAIITGLGLLIFTLLEIWIKIKKIKKK
ncbi:MAG: MFS transporter [Promethearchaeota archaeon]